MALILINEVLTSKLFFRPRHHDAFMMPIDCAGPGDVAIYLLTNLHEPLVPQKISWQDRSWRLCLVYRRDFNHFNVYRDEDSPSFALHIGCCWSDREPPNMGVHVSIGSLIDSVSKSIWNVWAPKKRLLVQER